jgi:hypothetical protein
LEWVRCLIVVFVVEYGVRILVVRFGIWFELVVRSFVYIVVIIFIVGDVGLSSTL